MKASENKFSGKQSTKFLNSYKMGENGCFLLPVLSRYSHTGSLSF